MHVVSVLGARQPTGIAPSIGGTLAWHSSSIVERLCDRRHCWRGRDESAALTTGRTSSARCFHTRRGGCAHSRSASIGPWVCKGCTTRCPRVLSDGQVARHVAMGPIRACVLRAAGGARLACIANPSAISWPVKQLPPSVSRSLIYLLGKTRGTWCDRTATYVEPSLAWLSPNGE